MIKIRKTRKQSSHLAPRDEPALTFAVNALFKPTVFVNAALRSHSQLISTERDGYFAFRCLIALLLAACSLHAHSLHQSTAETEWNAETKKLEVSLTVFINDLELALMRQSEREMRIEKTPAEAFDAQTKLYLAKNFVVSDSTGQKAEWTWIGRQIDAETKKSGDPTVTLFFEITLPGGLKAVSLQNGVLQDLFEDQLNLLHFRNGAEKVQMQFQCGDEAKRLSN